MHRRHTPGFFDNKARTYGEYLIQKASQSKQLGQDIIVSSGNEDIRSIDIANMYLMCSLQVNLRIRHASIFIHVFLPKEDDMHQMCLNIEPGGYVFKWMINPWTRTPMFVVPSETLPHIRSTHAYDFKFRLTCLAI